MAREIYVPIVAAVDTIMWHKERFIREINGGLEDKIKVGHPVKIVSLHGTTVKVESGYVAKVVKSEYPDIGVRFDSPFDSPYMLAMITFR